VQPEAGARDVTVTSAQHLFGLHGRRAHDANTADHYAVLPRRLYHRPTIEPLRRRWGCCCCCCLRHWRSGD